MKKILLLAAAALMVTSANAQLKRSETTVVPSRPQVQLVKPEAKMEVAQKRMPGTPVPNIKRDKPMTNIDVWYHRPAGAFPASVVMEEGVYAGMLYAPYIAVTPYVDYTFHGFADGQTPDASFEWEVQYWDVLETGEEEQIWNTFYGHDLTMQYGYEIDSVPYLYVVEPNGKMGYFNLRGFEMGGTSTAPTIVNEHCSAILSVPSTMEIWDTDYLKSSKNFCYGGLNGDQRYPMTYYSGAEPYGSNAQGWWFGKNGFHQVAQPRYFVDGIAQAFEKPTFPYLLKQVVLDCAILEVADQVDMTCRIYKLDSIPAYINDSTSAVLPLEPGELIAQGRATLTPETAATTGDMVIFTLFGEEDGLQYDITPTIDCAILICIDGYNDPEMENLADFSALIASDDMTDEGFGELAYLKFGYANEDGSADYHWEGLNGFFSSGAMKTGFTIFLSTENPYLTFNYNAEDGEYLFPNEGGLMEKHFGSAVTRSIEFWAWTPSADDAWFISCADGEEVPEWLSIELTDQMKNGEFSGLVNAEVVAEPLPDGVTYREAIVRFEFPGAYIDYKFMQGEQGPEPFNKFDIDRDGEVGLGDINYLTNMLLNNDQSPVGDCDEDGEVTLGDLNALVNYIMSL